MGVLVPPCFHTPLRIERIMGTERDWKVYHTPLIFESVLLRGCVVLPVGAVINFGSQPPIIWTWLPPTGAYDFGTAMHDGGYRGLLQTLDGTPMHLIRVLCDKLLLEACEATGVDEDEREALYRGVRLFGGPHYHGLPGVLPEPKGLHV